MQSGGARFTPVISSLSLRPPFFMSGFWNKSLIFIWYCFLYWFYLIFCWLLATFSLENWNSSNSQMLFSSSPMKSSAVHFIPLFISPFSSQPTLSKHCFQASSPFCTVPEVFISIHSWHDGEPHKRPRSDFRRWITAIRETRRKSLTGARTAFTSHQLHTHTHRFKATYN